jgi:carboxyl-terminal processing protease
MKKKNEFLDDAIQGLVLDLRSNPGGLLTSAVDVATLFVPNGSDIVSAKGRGFPETLYRSKTEPILNPSTRLAVLVNEQTASAAEIVAGAIQDLDVGVVVGKGRTFGKGLVQNVQGKVARYSLVCCFLLMLVPELEFVWRTFTDLPYQTALKYTVAKYYTPSGRCIQSTVYETDGGNSGAKYKSKKVADKDRNLFYTAHGRQVKDGGGVEVDVKVEPQKASPLEIILLNSGAYSDYAAEWSKKYELTDNFKVDDATYKDFQRFVEKRQKDGDMKLEILYDTQLKDLQKKLKASELVSSSKELEKLRSDIIKDVKKDFSTYKNEIIEDLEQNILARYLPDSMLIERGLRSDEQVAGTALMLKDGKMFDKVLARDSPPEGKVVSGQSYETSSTKKPSSNLQSRTSP